MSEPEPVVLRSTKTVEFEHHNTVITAARGFDETVITRKHKASNGMSPVTLSVFVIPNQYLLALTQALEGVQK
jgi:hypothetical protein